MKGYPSVPEMSYNWNVSEWWFSKLAQDGRIPGAEQFGWFVAIPEDAEKPSDPRRDKENELTWEEEEEYDSKDLSYHGFYPREAGESA